MCCMFDKGECSGSSGTPSCSSSLWRPPDVAVQLEDLLLQHRLPASLIYVSTPQRQQENRICDHRMVPY